MAYSYTTYTGDGSAKTFGIPFPYLHKDHISLAVNSEAVAWEYLNAQTISCATAPPVGAIVRIRRTTPRERPVVDYQDGSTLTELDMDLQSIQLLYIVQEVYDAVDECIALDDYNRWDAGDRRIVNVGDPINKTDAATKDWVEALSYHYEV